MLGIVDDMEMKEFIVATPEDFGEVVECVLGSASSSNAVVVTLTGDLGAGKTTFTQQIARHLGITEHVTSPTFGIMKSYEISSHPHYDHLVHIDAYRIEDIAEAGPLRLQEVFATPRTLVCLEWPEHVAEILPEGRVEVVIEIGEGEERHVSVVAK